MNSICSAKNPLKGIHLHFALKRVIAVFILTVSVGFINAQSQWPKITSTTKPWTRWWWMGSAVDEKNISFSLHQFSRSGFGGVEIVPIYGAKGYESRYIKYLSPQWMKMLDHTVKQSRALNMGVYISVGTGWPIGGTHVTVNDAAARLIVQQYQLKANARLTEKIAVADTNQIGFASLNSLVAFDNNNNATDLIAKVAEDGSLNFTNSQELRLYALFTGKTKQAVKRAAPGGEGFTIDHFSKTATANYFKLFDTAFGNSSHSVRAFFNDSYEVYNASWTPDLFNEFLKRRGYDLSKYIDLFSSSASNDTVARLKSDYRETLADLMRENFSMVFTQWTGKRKTRSVNQAHGSPGNLLDLYAAFDIPETETFGSSYFAVRGLRRDSADIRNVDPDPNMLKFASSAANAYGKPLASCETFTWLGEHFKTAWSQCKPEVDQVFLSGLNHVFYHGTTYSPADAGWPGWLFYASVNFVPNNSLWPHLGGLNDYIARCQSVLQAGESDNEILIYWPIYDIWHNPAGMEIPLTVHNVDRWLHPTEFYKKIVALQNAGYSLDFASDKMLHQASVHDGIISITPRGAKYKVLVIPACQKMPVVTLQHIIRLANQGATVIIQQFPEDVPGFIEIQKRKEALQKIIDGIKLSDASGGLQTNNMGKGRIILGDIDIALDYSGIHSEKMTATGLKFIRRKLADGKYYFIANNTATDLDETIFLQTPANAVLLMDPLKGDIGTISHEKRKTESGVRLQLKSGESVILKLSAKKETAGPHRYRMPAGEILHLQNSNWRLHFKQGGSQLPAAKQMTAIRPWTTFTEDTATQSFSGTGVYTSSFTIKNKAADYLLEVDKIYESARIIINGKDAGLIWSLPYELRVGKYLKEGENTISIEVCNLMANRIREMDRKGEPWRNYHEINFVNINYTQFDASKWQVQPSGIDGEVKLIPLE